VKSGECPTTYDLSTGQWQAHFIKQLLPAVESPIDMIWRLQMKNGHVRTWWSPRIHAETGCNAARTLTRWFLWSTIAFVVLDAPFFLRPDMAALVVKKCFDGYVPPQYTRA